MGDYDDIDSRVQCPATLLSVRLGTHWSHSLAAFSGDLTVICFLSLGGGITQLNPRQRLLYPLKFFLFVYIIMFSYRIHMKGVHCYTINRRQANPYLRKPDKKLLLLVVLHF